MTLTVADFDFSTTAPPVDTTPKVLPPVDAADDAFFAERFAHPPALHPHNIPRIVLFAA